MASKLLCFAAAAVAGLALVACGDDADEEASAAAGQQQTSSQGAPDAAAAQRVETYLKDNAKRLPAGQAKGGQVISFVEVSNGELKIWTFLNSDIGGGNRRGEGRQGLPGGEGIRRARGKGRGRCRWRRCRDGALLGPGRAAS